MVDGDVGCISRYQHDSCRSRRRLSCNIIIYVKCAETMNKREGQASNVSVRMNKEVHRSYKLKLN